MAIAVNPHQEQRSGLVYTAEHRGEFYWFAVWYDHTGRLVRERLCYANEVDEAGAWDLASRVAETYIADVNERLVGKEVLAPDELYEMCQRVDFPRPIVARRIRLICERIALEDRITEELTRQAVPGLILFADRCGISMRQLTRWLNDEELATVPQEAIDQICCEFNVVLDDFIADSLDWAKQQGEWAWRIGTEDPWPVGYAYESAKPSSDDDLL